MQSLSISKLPIGEILSKHSVSVEHNTCTILLLFTGFIFARLADVIFDALSFTDTEVIVGTTIQEQAWAQPILHCFAAESQNTIA